MTIQGNALERRPDHEPAYATFQSRCLDFPSRLRAVFRRPFFINPSEKLIRHIVGQLLGNGIAAGQNKITPATNTHPIDITPIFVLMDSCDHATEPDDAQMRADFPALQTASSRPNN